MNKKTRNRMQMMNMVADMFPAHRTCGSNMHKLIKRDGEFMLVCNGQQKSGDQIVCSLKQDRFKKGLTANEWKKIADAVEGAM